MASRFLPRSRSLCHPCLPASDHLPARASSAATFTFVIGCDTQLGMSSVSQEWATEMALSERAVRHINSMTPKPAFVSICGDLVDMHEDLFPSIGTPEERIHTQLLQYKDFQLVWSALDPSVPLVCICGNHDVGNTPTAASIERYKEQFGDDYFSYWCNGCLFVCVNSNLYNDYSLVPDRYVEQHAWLESELAAGRREGARRIFVLSHHPWFLFDEKERPEDLLGHNTFVVRGELQTVPDSYFSMRIEERKKVLQLCRIYGVDACFSGHYHQNLVSRTSWGMPMIVTGPICDIVIESKFKNSLNNPENDTVGAGVRVVTISDEISAGFSHAYELI